MKVIKGISGATFLTFGLLGCAVSLFAILDPTGTQMADENNPFGAPPGILSSLMRAGIFVAISTIGAYLLSTLRSSRYDA